MWVEWQWLQLGTNLSWPILSPTGDRIRSKVELTRYLGPACDLTLFDFKQGVLCYPSPKVLYGVEYSGTAAEPPDTHPRVSVLPALALISRTIPWPSPAGSGRSLRSQPRLGSVRLDLRRVKSGRRHQGMTPRLTLTQSQLHFLHLGECWARVKSVRVVVGRTLRAPRPRFPS